MIIPETIPNVEEVLKEILKYNEQSRCCRFFGGYIIDDKANKEGMDYIALCINNGATEING